MWFKPQPWTKVVEKYLKLSPLDDNYNKSPKLPPPPSRPKAKLFARSANNRGIRPHCFGSGGGGGGKVCVRKWQIYVIRRNLFSYGEMNRKSVNNFV